MSGTLAQRVLRALRRPEALWTRWRRLPAVERHHTVRFLYLIPIAALSLRTFGYHRTMTALTARSRPVPRHRSAQAQSMARALRRVVFYAPYSGNCLSQSVALWWQLRRAGLDSSIVLGVRIEASAFTAHAWVEIDERALNDSVDVRQQFHPFVSADPAL
jgi:hypothetical protein